MPPEETRGNLRDQIHACKMKYSLGYQPALQRLGELSEIDAAQTKSHRSGPGIGGKVAETPRFVDKSG
jgi:hypothetical protein